MVKFSSGALYLLLIVFLSMLCAPAPKPARGAPLLQIPTVAPDAITTPGPTPTPSAATAIIGFHRQEISSTYTVRAGDTLLKVALETGVDLEMLPCAVAPDFTLEQPLVIGNVLELPSNDTLCHQIQPGDTLASIARRYGVAPDQIYTLVWNRLTDQPLATWLEAGRLQPGHHLRIPMGLTAPPESGAAIATPAANEPFLLWMLRQPVDTLPFMALAVGGPNPPAALETRSVALTQPGALPPNWPYGSGNFTWPVYGWLTQGYRYDHRAIDIAAPAGTTVTAADRGVVVRAGWNEQGYGFFVVIDHNIDYITLYAHLNEVLVTEGQVVGQGEVIGKVGSTGNSTGPHLHFEIRDFGRLTNPLELLAR